MDQFQLAVDVDVRKQRLRSATSQQLTAVLSSRPVCPTAAAASLIGYNKLRINFQASL